MEELKQKKKYTKKEPKQPTEPKKKEPKQPKEPKKKDSEIKHQIKFIKGPVYIFGDY